MEGLPALVVLGLVGVVALAVTVGGRPGPSPEAAVAAARRHALVVSITAVVVGLVVVGWLLWAAADPGHGFPGSVPEAAAFSPLAFALAHTVVLAVGELSWPRPTGPVRRARLVRRRLADVAPRRLFRLALAATAVLVVCLALGALLSAPDGRSITATHGPLTTTKSPWLGPHYGGVLTTELVLLAVAAAAALWLLVSASASVGWAPALLSTVVGVVGLVLQLSGLVVLCWPAPRVPATEPVAAGG